MPLNHDNNRHQVEKERSFQFSAFDSSEAVYPLTDKHDVCVCRLTLRIGFPNKTTKNLS